MKKVSINFTNPSHERALFRINPKLILCLTLIFSLYILCTSMIGHATESTVKPAELEFTQAGGGKYIYCNNTEGIFRYSLADSSNPNPVYTMNNENLTPNNYYVYLTHINYATEYVNGTAEGLAYAAELDLEIYAEEDSVLKIYNAAFETPLIKKCTKPSGEEFLYQTNWGALNACATMIGHEIWELNSYKRFNDYGFTPQTISIKKGETVWLSQYVQNYSACGMTLPVFMAADTELVSGMVDMNVVELKSKDGKVGDRSEFDRSTVAFGSYLRDRCHKGVADSLPEVSTSLSYKINDSTPDGEYLPVTLSNQYAPEGVTITRWVTQLNPQSDIWSKTTSAESDMLPLYYYDPAKPTYYGKNVPDSERDNVWVFDTKHSDTKAYVSGTGYTEDNYIPNYTLDINVDNTDFAASMGNYGVTTRYNLEITNDGTKTRYFNYDAMTSANIIVATKDHDGNYTKDKVKANISDDTSSRVEYLNIPVISKGGDTWTQATDTCAYVKLPPNKTTEFIIEVTLPVNYLGGTKNQFKITDDEPVFNFISDNYTAYDDYVTIDNTYFDQYMASANGYTKNRFEGNLTFFEVNKSDYGYVLRWKEWDDHPNSAGPYYKPLGQIVYFLDNSFNLIGQYQFEKYPKKAICANGKYIVTFTDLTRLFSTDGVNWHEPLWTPAEDETYNEILVKYDNKYISFDQPPILHNDRTLVPMRFIFTAFGLNVDWDETNNTALANDGNMVIALTINSNIAIVNGMEYTLDTEPLLVNDRTLIPVRFLSEMLGYNVDWNDEAQEVSITSLPKLPENITQHNYVIYKEAYRDNRIELAVFDSITKDASLNDIVNADSAVLEWDSAITLNSGGIFNDVKYYYDKYTDSWIEFESGYGSISNSATSILKSNLQYVIK